MRISACVRVCVCVCACVVICTYEWMFMRGGEIGTRLGRVTRVQRVHSQFRITLMSPFLDYDVYELSGPTAGRELFAIVPIT